jgi:hypothetical protein
MCVGHCMLVVMAVFPNHRTKVSHYYLLILSTIKWTGTIQHPGFHLSLVTCRGRL